MAQNDIYLVRQKADGTFEEIAHSPFQYDASSITDLPDKASNTFHINTKLRVDELEVNGKTTVIHTDTNTSEQLLVTNDGTGPAAIINQLGQQALIDIQDDGHSALYIRGDAPFGGFVGLGETNPQEQLHLSGSMLLENTQLLMSKNVSGTKVNILGLTNDDVTNLNNVGNGITLSTGTASSEEKVFIHPSGRVGIGILKNDPGAVLELKRDSDTNLLFTHKTTSISSIINIDKPEDKVVFKTLSDNDLSLGTNALDFFTLTKEGNITLEQKTSGSTLTGGDLTIDGTFTSKGDMISIGSEEILFSKSLTSSGMNVAKSYRVLEVGYNTHHWDHGTSFVVEVYSNHYSSQGYQKYLLSHTHLDASAAGSQDGIVDKTGSRDYVLKILEHEGDAGSYEFRVRLGSPEDTGVNVNDFDIALVPLYVDVTNYANVRVKVTSFNSDSCKRISFDSNWGAATADDEFKFNPLPPAEDITWSDYPDLPGTLDYVFAGRQALYADVLFGDGRINRIGEGTTHQNNIQWSLKLADTNVSMTVPGNVGIGTASPGAKLEVKLGNNGFPIPDVASAGDATAFRVKGGDNAVIDMGVNGGLGGWLQSRNWQTNQLYYNLLLNPLGGNVGIGTTSPGKKLHVAGDSHQIVIEDTNAVAGEKMRGIYNNNQKLYIGRYTDDLNSFYDDMVIDSNGNVGIGTTNPDVKLHIIGDTLNNTAIFESTDGTSSILFKDPFGTAEFGNRGDNAVIMPAGVEKMRITSAGNVGIGTTSPDAKLHLSTAGTDGLRLGVDSQTYYHMIRPNGDGLYLGADDGATGGTGADIRFSVKGDEKMRIDSSGNVGIGTTSPRSELHIESNVSNHDTTLKIENRSGDTGGTAIEFQGYRDVDDDHWVAKIVADHENTTAHSERLLGSKLGFYTNNGAVGFDSPRMIIDQNGNVGIGTTSPDNKLEVKTPGGKYALSVVDDTASEQHLGGLFVNNNGATTDGLDLYLKQPGGSTKVRIASTPDMDHYFNNGGNVGIGTTSPSAKLEISKTEVNTYAGSIQSLNSGLTLSNTVDTDGELQSIGLQFALKTTGNNFIRHSWIGSVQDQPDTRYSSLIFGTDEGTSSQPNRTEKMRIKYNGNVGIGTTSPDHKLTVYTDATSGVELVGQDGGTQNSASSKIIFNGDKQHNGPFIQAINTSPYGVKRLGFFANRTASNYTTLPTESMSITNTGNVGIGTTDPKAALQVNGNILFGDGAREGTHGTGVEYQGTGFAQGQDFYIGLSSHDGAITEDGTANGVTKDGFTGLRINSYMDTDNSGVIDADESGDKYNQDLEFYTHHYGELTTPLSMVIKNNGNVGIGITNPTKILSVQEELDGGISLSGFSNNSSTINSTVGIDLQSNEGESNRTRARIVSGQDGSNAGYLSLRTRRFVSGSASIDEAMRIDSAGKVGIGTTTPERKLEVSFNEDNSSETDYRNVEGIRISNNNQTAGSLSALMFKTPGSSAGITAERVSTDAVNLHIISEGFNDGVPSTIMSLLAGGNVGIGITNPSASLHIKNSSTNNALSIEAPQPIVSFIDSTNDNLSLPAATRTNHMNVSWQAAAPSSSQGLRFSRTTADSPDFMIDVDGVATFNHVLQAHGGMTIATNEDSNTPELTLKRFSSTSASGSDDIVDIRVADGGLNFIINNDADADSGTYNFRKMAAGLEVAGAIDCGTITTHSIIRKAGDTDTYLEFHAANSFRVVTGGTEQLSISGSGLTIQDNILHTGDTNTYFGFHNNDEWRVVTGGAERLEVTNTAISLRSNTGITGDLTISGDLTVNGDLVTLNTTNLQIEDKLLTVAKNATNAATADNCGFDFGGQYKLTFQNESTNKLVIEDTSANTASLEIQGTGGAQLVLQDTNSSNTANQTGMVAWKLGNDTLTAEVGFRSNSDSDFSIRNGSGDIVLLGQDTRLTGTGNLIIENSNKILLGNTIGNSNTSAADAYVSILDIGASDNVKLIGFSEGENGSAFWFNSGFALNDHLNFIGLSTTTNTNAMTWTFDGRIGINTTNPEGKLEINHTGSWSDPSIHLKGQYPTIKFNDTNNNSDDWYIHANSNKFYIMVDRDGHLGDDPITASDNFWETPYPIELNSSTNEGYIFGHKISTFSGSYNDLSNKPTISTFSGNYNDLTNKPTIPTNNNQLTNGKGYVTSSGNTVIGTDGDINTSGATVIDQLNMTDGVIQSHSTRTMTLADLGYTGATNANNYSHPTFNSDDFSFDTGPMNGARVISDLDVNITTSSEGHVIDANGAVSTRILTLADLGYTGATNATNTAAPAIITNRNGPAVYFDDFEGDHAKFDANGVVVNKGLDGNENDDDLPPLPASLTGQNQTQFLAPGVTAAEIRTLIGAGTGSGSSNSSFSGNYNDLTNKPTIPDGSISVLGTGGANLGVFGDDYDTLKFIPGANITMAAEEDNGIAKIEISVANSNFVGTGTGVHTMLGTLEVQGGASGESIRAAGDIVALATMTSDDALKTNKVAIDGALDKVCSLNGFTFDWNEKAAAIGIQEEGSIGLSAQEIEKVVPEVVKPLSDTEYKYVNYEKLVPVLVEAIKELKSEIEQLKSNQCDC